MRHYQNLDEIFEELRSPQIVEIEGTFDFAGRRYYFTGVTYDTVTMEGGEDEKVESIGYKIWIEEKKDYDQHPTLFEGDYFPTESI